MSDQRAWQQKLTDSQRNVLQEIVDQIPTKMGLRDAIEGILDGLAGVKTAKTLTGEQMYNVYCDGLLTQNNISADSFDDLPGETQDGWNYLANQTRDVPFRFIVVNCTGADVSGTNDEKRAREAAENVDNYVIDTMAGVVHSADAELDDEQIEELK